jgi:ATP-dependent exoDNAse (exonuclease V) beta subunit
LYIANSEVIGFLLAVLTGFLNPDNQVVQAEVNYLYYRKIYPRLKALSRVPLFAGVTGDRKPENGEESEKQFSLDFPPSTNQTLAVPAYEPESNRLFEETTSPENELLQYLSGKDFQELIAGKPILEIIYSICEKFNLFSLTDELAYLQAFVDQISVFERNHASELTSFLNWWDENGHRFTIPISDSIDAINVLTIHKSKGLEFSHVFIPFFDWSIQPQASPEQAPLLWCMPDAEPFNEMELVPVRYKNDLVHSIFYREYFAEKFNTYIDNLNLMYVVFTRAKAGLWVWATFSGRLASVGDLLKQAVEKQSEIGSCGLKDEDSVQFSASWDPENRILEMGEPTVLTEVRKQDSSFMKDVRLSEFEFADFRKFLQIRKRGEDFFTHESKKQSGINKGKLIHEILSLIETSSDLVRAVKRIETEGKIGTAEAGKILVELTELLHDPEVKPWFDGTYQVINERNILTGPNGIKRPDRIMIKEDGVVVVDYKSGDTESDKYKYQLRTYLRELKNCGYENVSGYIWYTKQNKRIKV